MEKQLIKGLAQVTAMNTKMLVQIYELHHKLLEKVVTIKPDESDLLSSLSYVEQMLAALEQGRVAAEQMEKLANLL